MATMPARSPGFAESAAVAGYLKRLGVTARPAPTAATLVELQRRHLDTVPYENLAIMLGRPDAAVPEQALARIAAGGNAGYCFHHNGAFELVLRALGFAVERRFGQVWSTPEARAVRELNHLVLLVTIDGRRWWADTGLGSAFRDPVPVAAGPFRQGPFRYEITEVTEQGWTFLQDPALGGFAAVDVGAASPSDAELAAAHRELSTPPYGQFTQVLAVQRRDATGAEMVRGIRHTRFGENAFTRDLAAYPDWRAALESLGVTLDPSRGGPADAELRALHARSLAAHQDWLAANTP
jgi:arylamine N-acetyltransferase